MIGGVGPIQSRRLDAEIDAEVIVGVAFGSGPAAGDDDTQRNYGEMEQLL
jgi:hypothetical protein